jgi:ABC-2 type transport system ATP-binding protein
MSIIFENVTKTIRGKTVLREISLSFEAGRITGLRGINGSGKTMLLRLLAGLIHPTEGKITIDGKKLGEDIEFPPSMGLLIENPAFLGQYSGAENLEMLASLRQNVTKEDVRALLEKVGLAADGDTKYRKYSLGMKQRLGIAGAILGKPELLLLDEPTNALDTKGVELLRDIIGEERQRGAAVVVACHDAAFLDSISDEIYCLENGQLTDHLILHEEGGVTP